MVLPVPRPVPESTENSVNPQASSLRAQAKRGGDGSRLWNPRNVASNSISATYGLPKILSPWGPCSPWGHKESDMTERTEDFEPL